MKALRYFLAALLAITYASNVQAQKEAYAAVSADGKTVTFYYDDQRASRGGTTYVYPWETEDGDPSWSSIPGDHSYKNITKAVIDESFKNCELTSTSDMFADLESITTIEHLDYLNTSNVTDMVGMFLGCENLESLDLTGFNTKKVTNMRAMFSYCESLESLDLSNFKTGYVTDMGFMFLDCKMLKSLDLSGFNTQKVTDMKGMFRMCTSLTNIYCNDDWMEGKDELNSEEMFFHCTKLKGAVAFDATNVDASMANPTTGYFTAIEAYAVVSSDGTTLTFYYDDQRTSREGTEGTTYNMSWASSNMSWASSNYPGWASNQSANLTITKAVFDESFKDYHRLYNTNNMFMNLTGLTTIEHLDYLNTENVTNMGGMFYGCQSLESLDLSHFNTANVTTMYSMFLGCWELKSLDLSNFDVAKVTAMSSMFNNCTSLETIYCDNNWLKNGVESDEMFLNCTELKGAVAYDAANVDASMANPTTGYFTEKPVEAYAVVNGATLTFYYDKLKGHREGTTYDVPWTGYPGWSGGQDGTSYGTNTTTTKAVFDESFAAYDGLTSTTDMFRNMVKLEKIENLTYLNTSNVEMMIRMFFGCSSLTNLDLWNFNTEKVYEMSAMFSRCSSLTSLDLSSFNTANVSQMSDMFSRCKSLTSLDLSNFNMGKAFYLIGMFQGCSALTTIICDDDWSQTSAVSSHKDDAMFTSCTSLVGAVSYDAAKQTIDMANPTTGYFTSSQAKVLSAYVGDGIWLSIYETSNGRYLEDLSHSSGENECKKVIQEGHGAQVEIYANSAKLSGAMLNGRPLSDDHFSNNGQADIITLAPDELNGEGGRNYLRVICDEDYGVAGDIDGDGNVDIADVKNLVNIVLGVTDSGSGDEDESVLNQQKEMLQQRLDMVKAELMTSIVDIDKLEDSDNKKALQSYATWLQAELKNFEESLMAATTEENIQKCQAKMAELEMGILHLKDAIIEAQHQQENG